MKINKSVMFGLTLFMAGMLSGCGNDPAALTGTETTTETTTAFKTIKDLDATAGGLSAAPTDPKNKYTYFDLSTGQVVDLTDAAATTSENWDIAFKRSDIKLNGGISGTKGVVGYFTGNNAEAYATSKPGDPVVSWFETATADSELSDFTSVTAAAIPAAATDFKSDVHVSAVKGDGTNAGWWLYAGPPTHAVTAVDTNWWVVRSAGGNSYAKLHVKEILKDSSNRTITLEWSYQGPNDTTFGALLAPHAIVVPVGGGAKYLDFDMIPATDSSDPNANANWDMKVEFDGTAQSYKISLNGGITGTGKAGAFGPTTTPETLTSKTDVKHFFADKAGGVFNDASWYAYSLKNDHKLWPNYRVYLVKSGENVYKIQFLSYYHSTTNESGWNTFRFEKIKP